MRTDITELLMFFDSLDSSSNEEMKYYWFKTVRPDGVLINFIISIYNEYVNIGVSHKEISFSDIELTNCLEIRILDQHKKCLEIIQKDQGRCFLSLQSNSILTYSGKDELHLL